MFMKYWDKSVCPSIRPSACLSRFGVLSRRMKIRKSGWLASERFSPEKCQSTPTIARSMDALCSSRWRSFLYKSLVIIDTEVKKIITHFYIAVRLQLQRQITSSTVNRFWKFFTDETAMNYLQNKCNISRHLLKTLLHYRVKHKSLNRLHLLYQFLMTKLRRTFMITLWIVNRFEKYILRILNIASLL